MKTLSCLEGFMGYCKKGEHTFKVDNRIFDDRGCEHVYT